MKHTRTFTVTKSWNLPGGGKGRRKEKEEKSSSLASDSPSANSKLNIFLKKLPPRGNQPQMPRAARRPFPVRQSVHVSGHEAIISATGPDIIVKNNNNNNSCDLLEDWATKNARQRWDSENIDTIAASRLVSSTFLRTGVKRRNRLNFRRDTKKWIHKTLGQFISSYFSLFFPKIRVLILNS